MKTLFYKLAAAVLLLTLLVMSEPAAAASDATIDAQGPDYSGVVLAAVNTDLSTAPVDGYTVVLSDLQADTGDALFATHRHLPIEEPTGIPGVPEQPRESAGYAVGDRKTVACLMGSQYTDIEMTCLYISAHCTVWTQVDGQERQYISAEEARQAAAMFEEVLPKMAAAFGDDSDLPSNWVDTDYDDRVALLIYDIDQDAYRFGEDILGTYTAGYFLVQDLVNASGYAGNVYYDKKNCNGNAMDCLHLDTCPAMYKKQESDGDTPVYDRDITRLKGTMVHEFQHMMTSCAYANVSTQYALSKDMEVYFNEAMSMAAEHLIVGESTTASRVTYFNTFYTPGTSLFSWQGSLSNYSLSYLFGQYVRCRYGQLTNTDGWTLYSDVLQRRSAQNPSTVSVVAGILNTTPQQLLQDFWWSLYLNAETGIYGFNSCPSGTAVHETWSDIIVPKMTLNPAATTVYPGGGIFYHINDGLPGTVSVQDHDVLRYAGLTRPQPVIPDTRSLTVTMGDSKSNGWGSSHLELTWVTPDGESITQLYFGPKSGKSIQTEIIPDAMVGEPVYVMFYEGSSGGTNQCSFTISYTDDPTGELLYASWESGLPEEYVFTVGEPIAEHTVTVEVNDASMGSVTLDGYRIHAVPADGYRISVQQPYALFSGTAAVTQSGADFCVDPSSDCTVKIYFEPKTEGGDGETTYRALLIAAAGCGLDPDVWTDVSAMATALGQTENYNPEWIVPYVAWGAQADVAATLQAEISRFFSSNDDDDVGLIYYSGHGTTDGTNSYLSINGSSISAPQLKTLLDAQNGTYQLILDACYSGGFASKSDAETDAIDPAQLMAQNFEQPFAVSAQARGLYSGDKYRILTTAAKNQLAWSMFQHGAGTTALLSGIGYLHTDESYCSYPADTDNDGSVTLEELFLWMQRASFYSTVRCYPQSCGEPMVRYDPDVYPGSLFTARISNVELTAAACLVTIETDYSGSGTITARYPLSISDYRLMALELSVPNAGGTIAELEPGCTTLTIPRTMLSGSRSFIRVISSDPGAAAICLRLDSFADWDTPESYGVSLTLPDGTTAEASDGECCSSALTWPAQSGEEVHIAVRFDKDVYTNDTDPAPSGCRLTVTIQDWLGRTVCTLADYQAANYRVERSSNRYLRVGCSDFYWAAMDDAGNALPEGCYAVTVQAEYLLESGVHTCESTVWFYVGSPQEWTLEVRQTGSSAALCYYLPAGSYKMLLANYDASGRMLAVRLQDVVFTDIACGALMLSGPSGSFWQAYLLRPDTLQPLSMQDL